MIHILGKIPRKVSVAVSGGPDSMAVLDFLKNSHDVTALYFHHGTKFSDEGLALVKDYCEKNDIQLLTEKISRKKKKSESPEEYWRNERYKWFNSFDAPIITAHNLDDVVEWYIFTALHGETKIIPYKNKNVIRPFLVTTKEEFLDWNKRKEVPFLNDPANKDRKYSRSIIRHDIMPHALEVNPGLYKVVKKLVKKEFKELYS